MYSSTWRTVAKQCAPAHKVDVLLIVLFVIIVILHVISLSFVVSKNQEVVDKFDPEHQADDTLCIFSINRHHPNGNAKVCNLIIYGSGSLAGCALLMITFLVVRIALSSKKLVIAIAGSMLTT